MADQISGLLSPFLRERRFARARPFVDGRVLDYGCGVGLLSERVDHRSFTGVDIDPESIAIARKSYPQHRFLLTEEFDDGARFDTVASLAVIEHLVDPKAFLDRARRWLAPGGRIVLTTPNPSFEWAHGIGAAIGLFSKEGHDEHRSPLDERGLREIAAAASLDVVIYRKFLFGANQLCVLVPRDRAG